MGRGEGEIRGCEAGVELGRFAHELVQSAFLKLPVPLEIEELLWVREDWIVGRMVFIFGRKGSE